MNRTKGKPATQEYVDKEVNIVKNEYDAKLFKLSKDIEGIKLLGLGGGLENFQHAI